MRMRSSYWSWKKGCDTKTKEWEEVKKNCTEELIALAKIIKVLILVLAFHKIICILTLCLNWTWKVKVINVWFSFETATADGFKRGGSGKWSPFLQKLGKRKMCWNSLWVRKPGTRACWKPFRRMTETWPFLGLHSLNFSRFSPHTFYFEEEIEVFSAEGSRNWLLKKIIKNRNL